MVLAVPLSCLFNAGKWIYPMKQATESLLAIIDAYGVVLLLTKKSISVGV